MTLSLQEKKMSRPQDQKNNIKSKICSTCGKILPLLAVFSNGSNGLDYRRLGFLSVV